jgi:hypothetical protein
MDISPTARKHYACRPVEGKWGKTIVGEILEESFRMHVGNHGNRHLAFSG